MHDCFSISEVIAYEIIGLAEPGKGASLLHNGATMLPGVRAKILGADAPTPPFSIPVNSGGGLMADGHPVGATGVRQVLDAYQQLTGQAGPRQIEEREPISDVQCRRQHDDDRGDGVGDVSFIRLCADSDDNHSISIFRAGGDWSDAQD